MTDLIYLTSTPYTGSSLMSILMCSHPYIATISELTGVNASIDVTDYRCSCGNLLTEWVFLRKSVDGLLHVVLSFPTKIFEQLISRAMSSNKNCCMDRCETIVWKRSGAILESFGQDVCDLLESVICIVKLSFERYLSFLKKVFR